MRELYFYSNHEEPNRVTIAGLYDNGTLYFGAARCSDKDPFIKKIGRAKARGRAMSHPIHKLEGVQDDNVIATFNFAAKPFARNIQLSPNFKEKYKC